MKTSSSHRVTSLLLALFIFISSSGISLNIHYCGSEVFDYTVIGEPKTCKKEISPEFKNELRVYKKSCCSFDHLKIETSGDYQLSDFDKEVDKSTDFSIVTLTIKTFVENSISFEDNRIYPPPPKIKNNNLYLIKESFLI